jgi:hypothetical protein
MKSSNDSNLAVANCSTEMRFLCDVRKKGTDGMAMQQECLETWGVTAGQIFCKPCKASTLNLNSPAELDLVTNTTVNVSTLGLHIKVLINN